MKKLLPWILVLVVCLVLAWKFFWTSGPNFALSQEAISLAKSTDPVGATLDKAEDDAQALISQAAGAASLVTTKAARDLELLIQDARQQLHGELNEQEDRLGEQEQMILGTIKQGLAQLHAEINQAGQLKDEIVLDVDDTLSRLPFTKSTPLIQRINGATQYYRDHGLYRVEVLNNFIATAGDIPRVSIEAKGKEVDPKTGMETKIKVQRILENLVILPPHKLVITLASEEINDQFKDDQLAEIPVTISAKVQNRLHFYQFWKSRFRDEKFRFTLELLPKYPATYRLVELDTQDSYDTSKVLTQKGDIATLPGCGDSGCTNWYTVCNQKIPAGSKPIGISGYYDSFSGWGGFNKASSYVTSTGMCVLYYQHSHNQARNVSIDVDYYPLMPTIVDVPVGLTPISFDEANISETGKSAPECKNLALLPPSDLKATSLLPANPSRTAQADLTTTANISRIPSFTDVFLSSTPTPTTSSATLLATIGTVNIQETFDLIHAKLLMASCIPLTGPPTLQRTAMGRLKFGRTYEARFNQKAQSFRLLVRLFTGEEEVVSPGHPAPLVDVTQELKTEARNIVVDIKAPW